ncbi:acyloxyacyl hydrolase [Aliiroseovarius subalbicans]|uniref:acyloxyacyl hydrolase n=1 Tax=Aliiroseovarius subalbicans TaxID=2925840 RepID=UPI001F59668D|nr:acyloxyacyl hydrolase [Aliiroseovarius subalbicans]MCI2399234.1 acyloxyacyl hydrolase [Aliiroseovarius subalbicans]
MDGTLAVMAAMFGIADMVNNHCDVGCLAVRDAPARVASASGPVFFQGNDIGTEQYTRHELARSYGPFQPVAGLSATSQGDLWAGLGVANDYFFFNTGFYVQLNFMPGVYLRDQGPVLGHRLEFRSGIEVGYETASGMRYALTFDHRSNGDITQVNPGLETVQFKISYPDD